jgi:hypothetical protein
VLGFLRGNADLDVGLGVVVHLDRVVSTDPLAAAEDPSDLACGQLQNWAHHLLNRLHGTTGGDDQTGFDRLRVNGLLWAIDEI